MKLNKQPLNPNKVYEVSSGGVTDLDFLRVSDLEDGQVAKLNSQGFVSLENIDFSTFGYEPTLQGPREIIAGTPEGYKITNYSSFRNYTLRFTGGEVKQTGDTITINAIRDGVQILVVNGYNFKIDVKKGVVEEPIINKVLHKVQGEFYDLTVTVSPIKVFPLPESQKSLEVQVFADPQATLLLNSYEHFSSTISETVIRIGRNFSTVYVRARYSSVNYGKSDWSGFYTYSFPVLFTGVNAGENRGSSVDVSGEGERFVVGSPSPSGASGTSGSITIYRSSEVEGSRYVHGPENVELIIPSGGSIRIVLDSQIPYDKTFTTSQMVNLPAWASGEAIGKGGPGSVIVIPEVVSRPEVGNSLFPNGLPVFVAPSDPIFEERTREVWVKPTYKEERFLENTLYPINKGLCCYLTEEAALDAAKDETKDFEEGTIVVITVPFTPKPAPENSTFLGYEKITRKTFAVNKEISGQYSVGVLVSEEYYSRYKVIDKPGRFESQPFTEVIGYENPGVGEASFPDGLPPYQEEVIGYPESYQDVRGTSAFIKIAKGTIELPGDLGSSFGDPKSYPLFTTIVSNDAIYVAERTFSQINQPTTINLEIPAGGSIQIKTTGSSTIQGYDQTFTTSQAVTVPGWVGNLTLIGKGGPGTKTWIEGTPSKPQQGNPSYPNGLPSYVPASGPIYRQEQTAVWVPPVYYKYWKKTSYNESFSYRDTVDPAVGYGTVLNSGYGNVVLGGRSELEDPNTNNYPVGMTGWSSSKWWAGSTNGKHVYGYAYATWICENTTSIRTAGYYDYQYTTVFVGYSNPAVGSPSYPTGLAPYVPATPAVPGYYRDTTGASAKFTIGTLTGTFNGGNGDTPAVLTTTQVSIGENDGFGASVAISHDPNKLFVIAGSPNDRYNSADKAGGCLYTKFVNGSWSDLSYLEIQTPVANANFGEAVDISEDGTYSFISAPGENKVYIYKNFVLEKVLSPSSMVNKTRFGTKISCSNDGTLLAVGYATGNTISLFKKGTGTTWTETTINGNLNTYQMTGKVATNGFIKIEQLNASNQVIKTKTLSSGSFNSNDWGMEPTAKKIRITGAGGYDTSLGILGPKGSEGESIYPLGTWGLTDISEIGLNMELVPYLGETTIQDSSLNYMSRDFVFKYDPLKPPVEYLIDINSTSDGFGTSLSLSGDGKALAVGVFSSTNSEGHVRVIDLASNRVTFINPRTPISNGYFGKSVCINQFADRLMITEPGRKDNLGGRDMITLDQTLYIKTRVERDSTSSPSTGSYGVVASMSQRSSFNVIGEPTALNNIGQIHVNKD